MCVLYACISERAKNGSRCETMYMPLCLGNSRYPAGETGMGGDRGSGTVDRSPGIPIIAVILDASMTPPLSSPRPCSSVLLVLLLPLARNVLRARAGRARGLRQSEEKHETFPYILNETFRWIGLVRHLRIIAIRIILWYWQDRRGKSDL